MSKLKIVCISNRIDDLLEWDRDHFRGVISNLTIGRTYDGLNISEDANPYKGTDKKTDVDIFVVGDLGEKIWIPCYMFEPLSTVRDEKLKSIGI
jgi:hypothetical protein